MKDIDVGGMEKELRWSGQKKAECQLLKVWQKGRKKNIISVCQWHSFKGEGTQEVCMQTSSNEKECYVSSEGARRKFLSRICDSMPCGCLGRQESLPPSH